MFIFIICLITLTHLKFPFFKSCRGKYLISSDLCKSIAQEPGSTFGVTSKMLINSQRFIQNSENNWINNHKVEKTYSLTHPRGWHGKARSGYKQGRSRRLLECPSPPGVTPHHSEKRRYLPSVSAYSSHPVSGRTVVFSPESFQHSPAAIWRLSLQL